MANLKVRETSSPLPMAQQPQPYTRRLPFYEYSNLKAKIGDKKW